MRVVRRSDNRASSSFADSLTMLTKMQIENFKSWAQTGELRLAPLTGLFGTNSSGKSSLIQFLLMLKQTAESADRGLVLDMGNDRSLTNLGSYSDILPFHNSDSKLSFLLQWDSESAISIKDPETRKSLSKSSIMQFSGSLLSPQSPNKPEVEMMRYSLGDSIFTYLQKSNSNEYQLTTKNTVGFKFKRSDGRKWPLPKPIRYYGFPDEVRTYHKNAAFLSEFELSFERLLKNIYYLGPLREFPRREYKWAGGDPSDMGRRGEFAISAILASRESGHRISRGKGKPRFTLEEYVAHWLKQLGLIHAFRIEEVAAGTNIYRAHIKKSPDSSEVLITDVGFGVSQILPVLVLAYYVPDGSTVILEQPEIHLHPSVQSRLADVFIDANKVKNVQFIIESHSEHLLRRLQRRLAEGAIDSNDLQVYFCSQGASGISHAENLHIDAFGQIRNWPDDFFGDDMEDLTAIAIAATSKRRSSN